MLKINTLYISFINSVQLSPSLSFYNQNNSIRFPLYIFCVSPHLMLVQWEITSHSVTTKGARKNTKCYCSYHHHLTCLLKEHTAGKTTGHDERVNWMSSLSNLWKNMFFQHSADATIIISWFGEITVYLNYFWKKNNLVNWHIFGAKKRIQDIHIVAAP